MNHPLFQQFPLSGESTISTGRVPIPYHIYNGLALFVGGTANYQAVTQLLVNEDLVPLKTQDGKAVMGIWIADFTEASLGPHHELQFSVFVTRKATTPVAAHPFSPMYAIFQPGVKMLCHGLWNNTDTVVAYNRELLSLNVLRSESTIRQAGKTVAFEVSDARTGGAVISGAIRPRPSLGATLSFMAGMGFGKALSVMRAPYLGMEVVNPKGIQLGENALARAYAHGGKTILQGWNPSDQLHVHHPVYQALQFTPTMVEQMRGFRFVYLHPEPWGTEKR